MNEREQEALLALKQSAKYREMCGDTIERVFQEELGKRKNLKLAEKEARGRLHQISGAFLTAAALKRTEALMDAYVGGDQDALREALKLHASTRERLPHAEGLYPWVFERIGRPGRVLDLACGLNPLHLGSMGLCVRGYDIHGGANALVNGWAARCAWDVRVETADLLCGPDLERADLALLMKLLPLIERQQKGASARLLEQVPAKHLLVSFPTKTLSGRGVGMLETYSSWFEASLPARVSIVDTLRLPNELCYLLEANHG